MSRKAMFAPFVLGAVLLIVVPSAMTFALALFDFDGLSRPQWAGAGNLRRLEADPILPRVLANTAMFVAIVVPVRVVGAFALALLLHRPGRGVGAARTAVYLPTLIPEVAYALAWLWIVNPLYGPLNAILAELGGPTPAWLTQSNQARVALAMMAAFQLGEGFIVALAARQDIPQELYELAALEGAGAWSSFRRVTLSVLSPLLLLLAMRDTVVAIGASFVSALVVTGGGPVNATVFLPLHEYRMAFESLRFGYAAMLSVLAFAMTAVVIVLQYRVIRPWRILID